MQTTLRRLAGSYTSTYLQISGADNGVLFAHVDNVNALVLQRLDELYTTLRSLLAESGQELQSAARHYDETDLTAARRSDSRIPLVADVTPSTDGTPGEGCST